MDTSELNKLCSGQIPAMSAAWIAEQVARDAISGKGLETIIKELFPSVDSALLKANRDLPNFLQQAVNRYVRALARGELNWEWDAEDETNDQGSPAKTLALRGRDLVQDATSDALISGKFAFFPSRNEKGVYSQTVLSGFLWPIYEAGNVGSVLAIVQIYAQIVEDKTKYQVRRYSAGLVESWPLLDDWKAFIKEQPQPYVQPHQQMPIAFRIVNRNVNREPEGMIAAALPAFRRYVKFAVLLAFIATRGGFEERLVKSDVLFQLAKEKPTHPLLTALKKSGPNEVRLLDQGASYERLSPVMLDQYREQEAVARADVRDALNMPDTDGVQLSGEALQEKREAYTESVESLASSLADALSEAHTIGSFLEPALTNGWRVTLEPRFSRDVTAERVQIREDVKAGVLPVSLALSALQGLGASYVTTTAIAAAKDDEDLARTPHGIIPPTGDVVSINSRPERQEN